MTGAFLRQHKISEITGTLSTENSTVSNLGAGGVFTGGWEEIKDYAIIKVGIYSDQDSATGGLCFQQSPDMSEIFDEPYDFFANGKKLWTPNPVLRYFRIVYTNGITPTTNFGIQTIYSSVYSKPTSHRLGDDVGDNDDTELVKAVISYRNDNDGVFNNVSMQNPFPVDGDSVYAKDIWQSESDIGDFSGSITDLFDNLHSLVSDTTANNPKEILIHFNRTVVGNILGIGSFTGNFSNTEIQIGNSGGIFTTVVDESADNTDYTTRTFQLPVTAGYNAVKLRFHTTDTVTISNLVILKTRSVVSRMQGLRDDGTIGDVVISNSNRWRTVSQPYEYAIAEGDLSDHFALLKFGTRTSVAAGVESVCWEGAAATYPYMTTAQQLQVSSTSASDSSGGIGIRTLTIEGLDSSYNIASETITMNGLTQVTTSNSYIRVFRAYGATCGTNYTNVGTISIYDNAGTTVQAVINIGDAQTLMTLWTVPAGVTAYLTRGSVSTDSNKGARASVYIRKIDGGILYPWRIQYRGYLFSGGESIDIKTPLVLPEKTDIEVRVQTPGSAGVTSFGSTFELWYE